MDEVLRMGGVEVGEAVVMLDLEAPLGINSPFIGAGAVNPLASPRPRQPSICHRILLLKACVEVVYRVTAYHAKIEDVPDFIEEVRRYVML
jgi:hypothetical protein